MLNNNWKGENLQMIDRDLNPTSQPSQNSRPRSEIVNLKWNEEEKENIAVTEKYQNEKYQRPGDIKEGSCQGRQIPG